MCAAKLLYGPKVDPLHTCITVVNLLRNYINYTPPKPFHKAVVRSFQVCSQTMKRNTDPLSSHYS